MMHGGTRAAATTHVVHLGQGLRAPSPEPCRAIRGSRGAAHGLHVAHHTLNLALHGETRAAATTLVVQG